MSADEVVQVYVRRLGDAEVRAKRLEYCGCVGILKRVSNLDAHKAETEVPDLPKRKFWFWCFHSDVVISLTIRKRLYNF